MKGEVLLGMTGVVAAREIRQRLRGRAFRGATALLLIGVAAAIVIPVAIKGKPHTQQVGVVGVPTASLRGAVTAAAASGKADVHLVPEADAAAADAALRSGRIDVAIINGDRLVVKRAPSSGNTTRTATFARALAQVLGVDKAVRAAGLTAGQVARIAGAEPVPTAALEPARTSTTGRATAVIGLVVLMIMLTQYLSWTLIGVMEEKSSRVVEVLLSTVRPRALLAGKVLGIGLLGLAQLLLVAAVGVGVAIATGTISTSSNALLPIALVLGWFVLGYAFYATAYAAAAARVSRQEDLQNVSTPMTLVLVGSFFGSLWAASNPGAPLAKVLAVVPPFSALVSPPLMAGGDAPLWQLLLAFVLMLAAIAGLVVVAARLYEGAVLHSGSVLSWRSAWAGRRGKD